jgi:hypothetical protein
LDGTPRVLPTWFHWTGDEIVMGTFVSAPHIQRAAARLKALQVNPNVAITIDTEGFPPHVLLIRGQISITEVYGVVPEYALAARRYLGEEAAAAYLIQVDQPGTTMARIALRPTWAARQYDNAGSIIHKLGFNYSIRKRYPFTRSQAFYSRDQPSKGAKKPGFSKGTERLPQRRDNHDEHKSKDRSPFMV